MTAQTERVALVCPACSPDVETVHEVLNVGGQATVRCTDCEHVHKTTLPSEDTVERDVIVSQDDESFKTTVDAPRDEEIAVGEEFVVETELAIMTARITSLETGDGRTESATVEDVDTIWTRAVGNVSVNVTMHPNDGRHDETRSFTIHVPGEHEFAVNQVEEFGDEEFEIEGIYVRDDAVGYDFDKLDHGGDAAVAKDVKRLYVRDQSSTAWSAW
jgi:uncharacterized Zn finger protein